MTYRCRRKEWDTLRKTAPPEIRGRISSEPAPPGFVKLSFGSAEAEEWVVSRLGPSLEAPYGVDARDPDGKTSGKWPARGS